MKFNVSSSALLSALQSVSKVIASKNTLPILDSFLFNLEGDRLTITASDVETRMITTVEVIQVDGGGLFAIEAKRLLDPLKELPEQPLNFDVDDESMVVNVTYANGKFFIPGQGGDAYPLLRPLNETAISFTFESQILLNGINRSLFAIGEDELRPVMNGVYFDLQPENITFVASDGHKLARLRHLVEQVNESASFILPKKPANILKTLLGKNADRVEVTFDENSVHVVTPSFEMTSRLIEGRYPNYNAVIPQDNPNHAIVDRVSFLSALKRVSVFSNQASGLIKLQFEENAINISAQDIDFSTSGDETVVCQYTESPLNIGFKALFLIDIVSNMTSENIVLQLADPSRACILIPQENEENEDQLMLIMPMMLNEY